MQKRRTQEDERRTLWRWQLAAIVSGTIFVLSCWLLLDSLIAITGADEGIGVTIPDFRGMHEEQLSFADWMEPESEYRYADAVERGCVVSQIPAAGTRRKLSASAPTCRIKLVISLGPAPQDGDGEHGDG